MNETLKTIHCLRSIHHGFSSQEIKDEDLETVLDACVRAANASNRQRYSIVVIEDSNLIKKLARTSGNKALLFCIDSNRIMDTVEHIGLQYTIDDISPFITGCTDTALAAQTAAIAAKSLGIESLFSTRMYRDIANIYELLDLPEKFCFPLVMLVLGYRKNEPEYKKGRVSGPGIIHYGKYCRATTDELEALVQKYDDPHMGINPTWKKKGYKHYLEWFITKWTGKADKKDGKSQMYRILDRSGYLE